MQSLENLITQFSMKLRCLTQLCEFTHFLGSFGHGLMDERIRQKLLIESPWDFNYAVKIVESVKQMKSIAMGVKQAIYKVMANVNSFPKIKK